MVAHIAGRRGRPFEGRKDPRPSTTAEGVQIRCLADQAPSNAARQVAPSLEDGYMVTVGERAGGGRIVKAERVLGEGACHRSH